jgi:hypothetical protein
VKASIQRLRAEVRSDRNAWSSRVEELQKIDLSLADAGALAQAAVALHHGYGAIESALERVARSIEGSLPVGRDWHVALLENMSLEIQGIRPRVLSDESLRLLRGQLAFRHFFRHSYAVSLEGPRLEALRADMVALRVPLERDLDALDAHLARVASESAG